MHQEGPFSGKGTALYIAFAQKGSTRNARKQIQNDRRKNATVYVSPEGRQRAPQVPHEHAARKSELHNGARRLGASDGMMHAFS
jgi:hypothetical protein